MQLCQKAFQLKLLQKPHAHVFENNVEVDLKKVQSKTSPNLLTDQITSETNICFAKNIILLK